MGSLSFNIRLDPIINVVNTMINNPNGLGSITYSAIYKTENIGAWDSYSQVALRYGLFALLFILFLLFQVLKYNFALGVLLIITFFSQSVWYFPFISAFYFWCDKCKGVKKL
jgi:ACR3 family arsenite efflux pump ArsB